ncbi:hypothetical protein D3C87_1404110 [compost metagenome]
MKSAVGIRRARVLSRLLLDRFGSMADVLAAGPDRLNEVAGMGPATISLLASILETAQKLARERIGDDRPLLSSSSQVREYLQVMMAHLPVEQLRILFLNKRNRLIVDEVQQTGTVDHTPAYPREIIRRTLELSASAIILAHNHPSGDPSPSTTDIRITKDIAVAAKPLGIVVHDHVIVGRSGVLSMRSLGML